MNENRESSYGRLMKIPAKQLTVDPVYQRSINQANIKKIINNFDWHKVDVVKVSYRDGEYFVYDGQHTVIAIKSLFGEDTPVACMVQDDLKWEDEAKLFVSQDVNKCPVKCADKFRANFARGDEDTKKIVGICKKFGIEIMHGNAYRSKFKTSSINTLVKYFDKLGEERFEEAIGLVSLTWNGNELSMSRKMLTAVFLFVNTYHGEFNKNVAYTRWCKVTPQEIINSGDNSVNTGLTKYAKVLVQIYNKGTNVNDRLVDKF